MKAEDGIRDDLVTGVQTCALPIYERPRAPVPVLFRRNRSCEITRCPGYYRSSRQEVFTRHERSDPGSLEGAIRKADPTSWRACKRSEERRVGKECRCGWWTYHESRRRHTR